MEGDQPQGLAALNGLVDYVSFAMQSDAAFNINSGVNGNGNGNDNGNGNGGTDGIIISPALEQLKMEAKKTTPTHDHDGSKSESESEAQIVLEAVYSIATQTPRINHGHTGTIISTGTYNDARKGWTMLAKEYASFSLQHDYCNQRQHQRPLSLPLESQLESQSQSSSELPLPLQKVIVQEGDAQLFQMLGGVLVQVEYIGIDENDGYWRDAGGAMGRFFFM